MIKSLPLFALVLAGCSSAPAIAQARSGVTELVCDGRLIPSSPGPVLPGRRPWTEINGALVRVTATSASIAGGDALNGEYVVSGVNDAEYQISRDSVSGTLNRFSGKLSLSNAKTDGKRTEIVWLFDGDCAPRKQLF